MGPTFRKGFSPFFFLGIVSMVAAKTSNPFDRITPVPANETIPVMDFFRPPVFYRPQLNATASHFAALVSTGADRIDAVVYDFAAKKFERVTGGQDLDVDDCDWLGEKHLLLELSQKKIYAFGLVVSELGKLRNPKFVDRYNASVVVGIPRAEPLKPLIWLAKDASKSGSVGEVLQIDALRERAGGVAGQLSNTLRTFPSPKGGEPVDYIADKDGDLAFGLVVKDGVFSLHRFVTDRWEKSPVDLDHINVFGPGDKPGELIVLGPVQKNQPGALRRFDAATGQPGEVLYQSETHDLYDVRLYRHPTNGRLLGLFFDERLPKIVWLDAAYTRLQATLEEAFPDLVVHVLGSDRLEKNFFVMVRSDCVPPRYFYFNRERGTLAVVTTSAPWIDAARMMPMKGLRFKTRDGIELDGYITLPLGASQEKPAPLVVLPHGGPHARTTWGWDPEVQFLASRGYAVFQPNYRGSTGYAWRARQDVWDFRKMHHDVTDGVKTLLKTGFIDPDRMAIMGASFGGYLAISGAAFEPDLYRCAITIAGVFDWERVMREAKRHGEKNAKFGVLRRHLGDPKLEGEKFEEISPLRHVKQIKIPVYVAHGTADDIASVSESKRLLAELKKHGVAFEKKIEFDEGHGFQRLQNQVELYTALEKFLATHLATRRTAVASP
jgi:acetyl esterase/lipase